MSEKKVVNKIVQSLQASRSLNSGIHISLLLFHLNRNNFPIRMMQDVYPFLANCLGSLVPVRGLFVSLSYFIFSLNVHFIFFSILLNLIKGRTKQTVKLRPLPIYCEFHNVYFCLDLVKARPLCSSVSQAFHRLLFELHKASRRFIGFFLLQTETTDCELSDTVKLHKCLLSLQSWNIADSTNQNNNS